MKTLVRNARQNFVWICGFLTVCAMTVAQAGAQAPVRIHAGINNAEQATLQNSLHPLAQAQFDAGRMAADTRLNGISMVFSRLAQQEADLQALIAAQQNPSSPFYHQWLTPEEFAARFGMTDADLNKVQSWLEQQGFSIDRVARSKNAIYFSGTARQVEQVFSTEMHFYKFNGTEHFAPSTALSVPAALAPVVEGIRNLDDFRPRAQVVLRKDARVKPAFTSSQSGSVFFAPGDIAVVYDIKPLYSASVNGAGQSITIVGQSAIQISDIEAFQNAAGFNVKDPVQYLVPNTGDSTVQATGDEAESDLDLEWSGAIAPGATINFVYTGNNLNYGAFDSLVYAIEEKIGTIISSSYGTCEAALGGQTLESNFAQATTQGQTIMSAAGDQGSTDCYGIGTLPLTTQEGLAVDYPASSPYVTGMGGTEISNANSAYDTQGTAWWAAEGSSDIVSSALQYIPEMAWNDDTANCGVSNCLSSGGGGTSTLFSKPSWQTGVPGISSSISMREVPDLALYASPSFPGYLFCTSDSSAWGSAQSGSCVTGFRDAGDVYLTIAGGTSFDGPIFSGILALISQKQGYTTGQGLINKALYTLAADSATYASAFHDITTGNNDCLAGSTNCSGTAGFSAGTGYDQVTGLGSVDASNLADAWPASTGPALTATTTTITASNSAPNTGVSDNFTIGITSSSGAVPSGTLTLTVDANAPITETFTNGAFTYTTSFSTAGSHVILAAYAGDTTYAGSTGSVTVNVAVISSGSGSISLSPAPSPSTLTVSQGSSGVETISVKPAGGYTGTVDLTIDAGSADSELQNLCWEWGNQNSAGDGIVPIAGTVAGITTLTLIANGAECAAGGAAVGAGGKRVVRRLHSGTTGKNTGGNPVPLTAALAGLLLAGWLGRGSLKLRGLAGLILLAAVGLAVTACGNNGNTTTVSDPPQGTYTITVSAQDSISSSISAPTQSFTFVIN